MYCCTYAYWGPVQCYSIQMSKCIWHVFVCSVITLKCQFCFNVIFVYVFFVYWVWHCMYMVPGSWYFSTLCNGFILDSNVVQLLKITTGSCFCWMTKKVNIIESNPLFVSISLFAPHMLQHEAEMYYLPKNIQKLVHASSEISQMFQMEYH